MQDMRIKKKIYDIVYKQLEVIETDSNDNYSIRQNYAVSEAEKRIEMISKLLDLIPKVNHAEEMASVLGGKVEDTTNKSDKDIPF